jgi:hypothetical protein
MAIPNSPGSTYWRFDKKPLLQEGEKVSLILSSEDVVLIPLKG